jgi:hypothetical protein
MGERFAVDWKWIGGFKNKKGFVREGACQFMVEKRQELSMGGVGTGLRSWGWVVYLL